MQEDDLLLSDGGEFLTYGSDPSPTEAPKTAEPVVIMETVSGDPDYAALLQECLTGIKGIDEKLSIVSDYYGQLLQDPEAAALEPGQESLPEDQSITDESEDPAVSDPAVVQYTINDIVERMDNLLVVQQAMNDNIVRSYGNTVLFLEFILGALAFMIGGFFVYSLFSRLRS